MNIYEHRRYGALLFWIVAAATVGFFIYYSNGIVKDLAVQERSRMQIWADATKELVTLGESSDNSDNIDIDFLLGIIRDNRTIPVLLTDDKGNIINHRNFDLPEPEDSLQPLYISPANEAYLMQKLDKLRGSENVIHIIISPDNRQHLYYEDSMMLRRLAYYPYIQLAVMLAFVLTVYFAVNALKRAEQNKVWVGLSKETAHQLGTPISSLMAWLELLPGEGVGPEITKEMEKDVKRLETIASRFSKIGSQPNMERGDLNSVVGRSTSYMATRISRRIRLEFIPSHMPLYAEISEPLLEWVLENLIKNAVDAMPSGEGMIKVELFRGEGGKGVIEVSDTGKGIPRKDIGNLFNPGYTTKKRGWGLGLTLAKRIVTQYHGGKIFVKFSDPGRGTTFRIELPLCGD